MLKKLLLLSVVVSQLTISCSKDDSPVDPTDQNLGDQITDITKLPYSSLKPEDQKVKLEVEANEMLLQMDKSKTSGAIEAIQNLENLLRINTIDIFDGKNDDEIEDILNVSGTYAIYTWNNTDQIWIKSASATELKFIFPSKKNQTTNNASLSSKSTSSDIKVKYSDTDQIYLPTSVDATLIIDNAQAATFAINSKYSNGNETPDEASYKMILNDGYTFEISGKKAPAAANSSFSYNGKNLIKFTSGSTAKIDELIKEKALSKYSGTANGLIQIMDNFVIFADTDIATFAAEDEALEKSNIKPTSPNYDDPQANYKAYYTAQNTYYKKQSEGDVANFSKNAKLILVSKKDGTKIADVVMRSEKGETYDTQLPVWVEDSNNGGYWSTWDSTESITVQYYDEVYYLKFNDNTEVEMSAYFSTGFDNLTTKFENFLKAFERN
jgi:hypothetical protein